MKIPYLGSSWLKAGFVIVLGWLTGIPAQAQNLQVGQMVERVVCRADATQSYALYLPSSYTPTRRWPILYGFDPGGRGLRPVELFKEAAEKYGYIVVGSNNSRNGLGGELQQILNTFWQDTHERLAIDERRVYLTGMSGGSRVALSLARSLPEQIAGVIACAAGSPAEVPARKDLPYALIGLAGHEDFNLIELKQLTQALTEAGAATRLLTFDGGHAWPPEAQATQAVGWLELQAMKAGRRAQDNAWLEAWQNQQLAEARTAESEQRWLAALATYEALAQDFRGLSDVTAFASKAKELRANKEVREQLKREKTADDLERQKSQSFFELLSRLQNADEGVTVWGQLKGQIQDLRKKSALNEDSSERTAARRVLSSVIVSLNETSARLRAQKRYKEVALNLSLVTEARPDNPQAFVSLARAQALSGNKKQALESLRKAVELGLKDAAQLTGTTDFDAIRTEPAFKQLLEQLGQKS